MAHAHIFTQSSSFAIAVQIKTENHFSFFISYLCNPYHDLLAAWKQTAWLLPWEETAPGPSNKGQEDPTIFDT